MNRDCRVCGKVKIVMSLSILNLEVECTVTFQINELITITHFNVIETEHTIIISRTKFFDLPI